MCYIQIIQETQDTKRKRFYLVIHFMAKWKEKERKEEIDRKISHIWCKYRRVIVDVFNDDDESCVHAFVGYSGFRNCQHGWDLLRVGKRLIVQTPGHSNHAYRHDDTIIKPHWTRLWVRDKALDKQIGCLYGDESFRAISCIKLIQQTMKQ